MLISDELFVVLKRVVATSGEYHDPSYVMFTSAFSLNPVAD